MTKKQSGCFLERCVGPMYVCGPLLPTSNVVCSLHSPNTESTHLLNLSVCRTSEPCRNGWRDRVAVWGWGLGWSQGSMYYMRPRSPPPREGAILREKRANHCKV